MKIFRVIVAGGRDFCDYPKMVAYLDRILSLKVADPETKVILISGMARGADSLAIRYAEEKGLIVEKFPADWETYGKSAGYRRNCQMAEVANALVAFPGGRGTAHMIETAKAKGLAVREVR
jgi:hypothetical protein